MPLKELRVDLKAVAKQDHDQRDGREVPHEAGARVEFQHAHAAFAEDESGQHEQSSEREHAAPREAGEQGAEHQQAAEHGRTRLKGGHIGSVPHARPCPANEDT